MTIHGRWCGVPPKRLRSPTSGARRRNVCSLMLQRLPSEPTAPGRIEDIPGALDTPIETENIPDALSTPVGIVLPSPIPIPPPIGSASDCEPFIEKEKTFYWGQRHTMRTDYVGRPVWSYIGLRKGELEPGGRRPYCQSKVGSWGGGGYVGGHLVADSVGGYGGRPNLTPQFEIVNSKIFSRIEYAMKQCGLNPLFMTDYRVDVKYLRSDDVVPYIYSIYLGTVFIPRFSYPTAELIFYRNAPSNKYMVIDIPNVPGVPWDYFTMAIDYQMSQFQAACSYRGG